MAILEKAYLNGITGVKLLGNTYKNSHTFNKV